jgi:hypothetical protein
MNYIFIPMAVVIFFAGFIVGAMFGSYLSSSFEITTGQILLGCVGMIGLAAPIYNSWLARSHNRLQVRPLLMYQENVDAENQTDFKYSVLIINNGLGPAIINTCEYVYDGETFNSAKDLSKKILNAIGNNLGYQVSFNQKTSNFINNDIVSINEKHMVLECVLTPHLQSNTSPDQWNHTGEIVREELNKLTIKISYRCAYNTLSKTELKSS